MAHLDARSPDVAKKTTKCSTWNILMNILQALPPAKLLAKQPCNHHQPHPEESDAYKSSNNYHGLVVCKLRVSTNGPAQHLFGLRQEEQANE